jgi:two-component system, NarL family, sensor histidine kinase DevS
MEGDELAHTPRRCGEGGVADDSRRLRSLFEASMALTSELSLDAVLGRLVEAAATLAGARYAALGVADSTGSRLERFLTFGLDEREREAIGAPPVGQGILGALLRGQGPLRLADLGADPRSSGFPPGHPPMRTFLGVPVLLRGVVYGSLYLTEKAGGAEFDDADEECVTLLAAQAAIAIENARLYEAATRWLSTLESLNDVGNALVTETDLEPLLELIATRLRALVDARFVAVLLPAEGDRLRFAAWAGDGDYELEERTIGRGGSISGRVLETGRSERIDSVLDDPDADPGASRLLGLRTGLWVPLLAKDRPIGVLAAHDKLGAPDGRFGDDDLRLAETFAARAAVAVDLSQRVARDSLRRVVAAQERERRRLARELHDETGQALASILLGLRSLEKTLDGNAAAAEALTGLRELAVGTLRDVRLLAVELRPKALDDFGLVAALERLTETFTADSGMAVTFVSRVGGEHFADEVAVLLYRFVQESLTNIVKHAQARNVSILLTRKAGRIAAVIEDDGRGFDPTAASEGFGIEGMRERVALVGGSLHIESSEGSGTTLVAEVPVS